MCLLDPRALQVHGHELHVSPICGDMKQPTVNKDPRPARTTLLTPTFIRIIVCFSCELITPLCPLHSHTDWLHSCVNYRDLKKKYCSVASGFSLCHSPDEAESMYSVW